MTDPTNLALNIDRLMRRIHAELHPQASEFDRHKVGPLGGMVLLTIGEAEPIDIQTVVTKLGRDKSQLSRLIQRLEKKGLIARKKSDLDGRISLLSLTEDGQDQLDRIKSVLSSIVDGLFQPTTIEDRKEFSRILETVLSKGST